MTAFFGQARFILRLLSCIVIGVKNQTSTIECYWKHLYFFFGLKVLASSAEKCGFDRRLGRSNDYEINNRH